MTDQELEAHFKKIDERLEKIEKAQGDFEVGLEKDRGDLQDFTIEVARLGGIMETMHGNLKRIAERVGEKVEDALEPIKTETRELKKTIEKKKVIAFREKPFWKFWR